MKIRQLRTLEGPNIFHHRPVLSMLLDLQDAAQARSDRLPGFADALLALLPGLQSHRCSPGRPGGFVERLRRGTYPGHVIEHVALELSVLTGIGVSYGRALSGGRPTLVQVVVRYRCEPGMRFLLESAVALVQALQQGAAVPSVESTVAQARRIVARHALGPSTQAIVAAAERRGIPWRRIGSGSLVRLGWGERIRWIKTAVSDATGLIAAETAQDKALTKELLAEAGISVPRGWVVENAEQAAEALGRLGGGPAVLKPLAGNHGRGCTLGVRSAEAAAAAYARAAALGARVLVEEQIAGRDYRLLVVGGRLVAASERSPAQVCGDGVSTIAQLIERENRDPARGSGHWKPLTRIAVDAALLARLARQSLSPESVPSGGERVILRDTANLSTGGTATDVTDAVHPDVALLAERAAAALGLDICGIDFVSPDIGRAGAGAVLEINAGPGLRMHQHPSAGKPRDAGGAIVEMLYPQRDRGRIPLVAVTGTNGKTTVTRMVAHLLAASGKNVGMACTDGVWIGGRQVAAGDSAGPRSARLVLADPTVQAAVLETARGGILRRGLGYDWSDVGIVTNVREDHLGQDGLATLDDLVRVKSLVAARVHRGGSVVLNADDEACARIGASPQLAGSARRLVYTSLHADHLLIRRHLEADGRACYVQDGRIVEARGLRGATPLVALDELPATLGGLADFHFANALAAVAAARALGLDAALIAAALRGFEGTANNRGRANLYALRGGYLLVDYGHNPHAYEAIAAMVARLPGYRVTAVIDMPGDRADELLLHGARVAGGAFERVILHRPHDARGRKPGAVAELICAEIVRTAPHCECLMARDEASAMELAVQGIGPGEFVVLCYERFEVVRELLERHGARPADKVHPRLARERERRWRHTEAFAPERRRAA